MPKVSIPPGTGDAALPTKSKLGEGLAAAKSASVVSPVTRAGRGSATSKPPPFLSKAPGANCGACPLKDRPFVHPKPRRADLAILGERPDKYEVKHGRYFAGPTGELLYERILPQAGIRPKDISLHNAVLCTVEKEKALTPSEWKRAIASCAPRLALDLKEARPKVVIATGKRALQALTGRAQITAWTGAPLQGWRFVAKETPKGGFDLKAVKDSEAALADFSRLTVLPTMHPAWLFKMGNINYLPMLRIHFERAKHLAEKKLTPWKWPTIHIDANAAALHMLKLLRNAGRAGKRISFDVETIGDDPFTAPLSCIGVGHRDIGAISLPWESYNAGKWGYVQGVEEAREGSIEKRCRGFLLAILADHKIEKVAQNGQYDRMCLRRRGIPVNGPQYDTMIAHSVYAPGIRHNLSLVCSIEFHAPRWKEEFKVESGKDAA